MDKRMKEVLIRAKEAGLTAPQIKEVKELGIGMGGIVVSLMRDNELTMTFKEAVEALEEIS
ncbi:hypothetical protein N9O51_05010 [Saprospiraceae bacterium]|nr:hypothetical protein [Saprospiraceae bacterium]